MIDVIFFLLVFFMLFTSFRTNPYGIDMELPQAVTVERQEDTHMIVEINEDGNFYYEGEQLPVQRIKEIALENHQEDDGLVVIINADKQTRYQDVILLMDNLREVGISNLALAAERQEN